METTMRKSLIRLGSLFTFLFIVAVVYAQDSSAGQAAIQSVTDSVKSYVPTVQKLVYSVAGVIGLAGGIRVYNKMNQGDQDVQKSIVMLVGSCIFIIAFAAAIPLFFGV